MAVLTANGINFSDATALNSKYGILPQNSINVFYSASAPPGWSQVTTHNDKTFRIVSGTGAGSGGAISFTGAFPNAGAVPFSSGVGVTLNLAVNASTIAISQFPPHQHPANEGSGNTANTFPGSVNAQAGGTGGPVNSGSAGATFGHAHPIGYTSASGTWSSSLDLRVQYIDVIICNFT
jgi:hypothetical protein